MALAQLIYVSRRRTDVSMTVLSAIVDQSAMDNARRGMTGALLCCGVHLMQILEGELGDIVTLFERIRTDPRHTEVRLLLCKNVDKRMFSEWGMTLADLDARITIDRQRLMQMLEDVRQTHDTARHSVEARLLINDFKRQMQAA